MLNAEGVVDSVRNRLSRNQLKDLILLKNANPNLDILKLTCYVLLQGDEYGKPEILAKFNLAPPIKMAVTEDAKYACMERAELVDKVLAFIQ